MRAHLLQVVQHRDHGARLGAPARQQLQQVGGGARVDGVEGLVQQDQVGILQQQPRKQRALHLAGRQLGHHARAETFQAHGAQRIGHPGAAVGIDPAPQPDAPPQAHRHQILHRQREAAVELGGLRQPGHAHRRVALDASDHVDAAAAQRRQQRALARAVGPDDGRGLARGEGAAEMVHRGVATPGHGQIMHAQRGLGAVQGKCGHVRQRSGKRPGHGQPQQRDDEGHAPQAGAGARGQHAKPRAGAPATSRRAGGREGLAGLSRQPRRASAFRPARRTRGNARTASARGPRP